MNKKILLSLLIIGVIASVASAGTWAYFSDAKATSQDFTDGYLKLGTITTLTFTPTLGSGIDKIVPGDSGSAPLTLTNSGNVPGDLYIRLSNSATSPYITFTATYGGSGDVSPSTVGTSAGTVSVGSGYVKVASNVAADAHVTIPINYLMATTVGNEAQSSPTVHAETLTIDAVIVQPGISLAESGITTT